MQSTRVKPKSRSSSRRRPIVESSQLCFIHLGMQVLRGFNVTFGQYKRLLLVVALPLIVAGIVFGESLSPYPHKSRSLLCYIEGHKSCRNLGPTDGLLYQSIRKQSPVWFDVEDSPLLSKTSLNYIAHGGVGALRAQVVSAVAYAPSPPAAAVEMSKLVGKSVDIILGMQPNEVSSIAGEPFLLRCNTVQFVADNKFASRCYGEGWGGPVTYTASGESADMLNQLRDSVNAEIYRWEKDRWIHRAGAYSMFLVGFLLISGTVWVSRKAIRYVKAG